MISQPPYEDYELDFRRTLKALRSDERLWRLALISLPKMVRVLPYMEQEAAKLLTREVLQAQGLDPRAWRDFSFVVDAAVDYIKGEHEADAHWS